MPDPIPAGTTPADAGTTAGSGGSATPGSGEAPRAAPAGGDAGTAAGSSGGAAPAAAPAGAPAGGSTASSSAAAVAGASAGSTAGSTGTTGQVGDWPSDWRQRAAGNDAKALKRLERYTSPQAAIEALNQLQAKISAGELRALPKKDASPEEQAAYRAALGVPEKPEEYQIAMADGLVIGKEDKPIVDQFLGIAHAANLTSEQVSQVLSWRYAEEQKAAEAMTLQDRAAAREAQDALRSEWGDDYRGNMNAIHGLLDLAPAGVKEKMLGKRMEDGRAFASDPDVIRWLASVARELNPAGTLVPAGGASMAGSIDNEIAKIEKVMKEDRKAYNADTKMQERYRELLGAKEKLAERGKA